MKTIVKNKLERAFSMLEVIISVFVITIGIVGAVNLANFSISTVVVGKSQVIAADLVQEGLEIVRNIRDTNWLKNMTWNNGLEAGNYRVQYNISNLLLLAGNPALKINSGNFYQYDSGGDTLFRRKISISNISADEIKVISEVTWSERGKSFIINAEGRFYDWK